VGFKLDGWDYLAFATITLIGACFLLLLIFLLGLPGRIAVSRKHPEAEAVNLMGYAGFLAVVPWIQALIWAFKPTDVVDIRNFPEAERRLIADELARMTGKAEPEPPKSRPEDEPPEDKAA